MLHLLLPIVMLAVAADFGPFDDENARKEGQRGNRLYMQEKYQEAAEAYAEGILAIEGSPASRIRYGLLNNLGASLLKSGNAEAAMEALDDAIASTTELEDIARSTYNAGNGAFAGQDLERALDYYRQSLITNPENEDAKFNYEFVKRRLNEQQQEQDQQGGQQDSPDQEDRQQSDEGEQNQDEQSPQDQPSEPQEDEQQGQQSDGEQDEQDQEQEQQQSQPSEPQEKLDRRQAEQILEALQNEEEQLLRQIQRPKSRPRAVEKDW